jgi:hypothetical protein
MCRFSSQIFNKMVIVWNNNRGQMWGFNTLEDYKWWMKKQREIDGFENHVYEVSNGQECTEETFVDMTDWNMANCQS